MATVVPGRDLDALDAAGVALAAATVGWTLWAGRTGGDPWPVAGLQGGCALTYGAARLLSRWQRPLVPVAVVTGVAFALVLESVVPSVAALGPPLDYANANAALYVLTAVAAAMIAATLPTGPATAVAVPVAAAFVVAAVVSGSVTGMVVLVLASVGVAAAGSRSLLLPAAAGAVVVQVVVAVTALLGVAHLDGSPPHVLAALERAMDERRVVLWRDAAVIAGDDRFDGAGPGRFAALSPTARADADARWAHSGFLQQAAEQGAVGLALLMAAFGWGFARLAVGAVDTAAVLGTVALAALGVHAGVDYVLHFTAVPLVAAALVGAATPPRRAAAGSPG